MWLPEDLIIRILLLHLEDRHGMTTSTRYAGLRRVCTMFRRICDSPEVLRRLQLRGFRQYVRWWPGVSWSRFEDRLRLAGNREAICTAGMQMMMEWRDLTGGQALVNQAAVTRDSCAGVLLGDATVPSEPRGPQSAGHLHTISGGPSQVDGRWENCGLPGLRHSVQRDLEIIASRLWLPDHDIDLLVDDTHVCTWAECKRNGDGTFIIRYCSAGCCIHHEYDVWTRHMNSQVEYTVSRM